MIEDTTTDQRTATKDPGLRGIRALLQENRGFRLLWYGQIVSQAGDWFNHVAVATLLLELTGSGSMVAWMLILRMLPVFLVAPVAGVYVDRLDRKKIMIATDLLRGALVPCFLLVREPAAVPLVYALVGAQVSLSAFFEPARSAALPSVVNRHQLLSANALMSVTWSLMLAVGSGLGGWVIGLFGLKTAFLFDSATFFASAWCIAHVAIPRAERAPSRPGRWTRGFVDLLDGLRYVASDRSIRSLVLVKTGVGLGGGMVLILTVFGERVFPLGASAATGIGVLFAARGVGTAIGPFLGRAISGYHEPSMRRLIGIGFFQAAFFIVLFGLAPNLVSATVLLLLAHLGTSVNWVFSSVLLQLKVPDEYRGRVFSAELALFTVTFCVMTALMGHALDDLGWSPRLLAQLSGLSLALPGVLWLLARPRAGR